MLDTENGNTNARKPSFLDSDCCIRLLPNMNRDGAIARAIRTTKAINAVMAAYRGCDYRTALQRAESLKDGSSNTAEYCFFRGSMLHHLGKLDDAESNLREGLALETEPRQRALVYNVIASVLMDQERFPESIAFFENAGRAWPDRGANHRGIAEVWLRQGREFSEALDHARQAVEIDRHATGMKKEALDSRLGEDLAVLAWAVAANSGDAREVESLLAKALHSKCQKRVEITFVKQPRSTPKGISDGSPARQLHSPKYQDLGLPMRRLIQWSVLPSGL